MNMAITDPARRDEPLTGEALRSALAKFATGVTVVTCAGESGPVGITVNSFTSVSLDPPLVLWSLARRTNRLAAFRAASDFSIHVMGAEQAALCAGFTKQADAFDPASLEWSDRGVPQIGGSLARFDCTHHEQLDGGDHVVFLSRVRAVQTGDAAPLVFFDSGFGGFKP